MIFFFLSKNNFNIIYGLLRGEGIARGKFYCFEGCQKKQKITQRGPQMLRAQRIILLIAMSSNK